MNNIPPAVEESHSSIEVKPNVTSDNSLFVEPEDSLNQSQDDPMHFSEGGEAAGESGAGDSQATADLNTLLTEKSELEHANFRLTTEVESLREKVSSLATKNQQFSEQMSTNETEHLARNKLFREMEVSKNELAMKVLRLECDVMRLAQEKDDRDATISTVSREAQKSSAELVAMREELNSLAQEKGVLKLQISMNQKEERNLRLEREKSALDKDMFAESKRWFTRELAERDSKVQELRVEMRSKEMAWQNERIELVNESDRLRIKVEELEALVTVRDEALKKNLVDVERRVVEHRREIEMMTAELRCKTQLADMYKDSMEKAEKCAEELGEQLSLRESVVEDTKKLLVEMREEMSECDRKNNEYLAEKDTRIEELEEELRHANELIQSKHGVNLNITEEELSTLCPAAAETSKLLKGGQSLTSIIREHARLAGELVESKEKYTQLETSMREVFDELEERAPQLMHQKEVLDKTFDQNADLKKQLQDAEEARSCVAQQRDAATRELAFTRAELEKSQNDFQSLFKKHHHVLFVMEREQTLSGQSEGLSESQDRQLYDSVGQLAKRNIHLEAELNTEKQTAQQQAIQMQKTEVDRLERELASSRMLETTLKKQLEELNTAFQATEQQVAMLSTNTDTSISPTELRALKMKTDDAVSEAKFKQMQVERLEQYTQALKEDKEKTERMAEDRVALAQSQVTEVKTSYARLEATLELQKATADSLTKELESCYKETRRLTEECDRMRAVEVKAADEKQRLYHELMEIQTQASNFKVQAHSATEELEYERRKLQNMEVELSRARSAAYEEQKMAFSMEDVMARLARIENEKLSRADGQNDLLRMERDGLKSSLARITEQLTHTKSDAKTVQTRLEKEMELLKSQLEEKAEQLQVSEASLEEIRIRYSAANSENADANTATMSHERLAKECQQLKNRTVFLESQLAEMRQKLADSQAESFRTTDEMQRVSQHSGSLESSLKQTMRVGDEERRRLSDHAKALQLRTEELSEKLAELRTTLDEKTSEINEMQLERVRHDAQLQNRITVLEAQVEECKGERDEVKQELTKAQKDCEVKSNEHQQTVLEVSKLMEELSSQKLETELVLSRLEGKDRELFDAQNRAREAEEARASMEDQLSRHTSELETKIHELTKTLATSEERLRDIVDKYEQTIIELAEVRARLPAQPDDVSAAIDSSVNAVSDTVLSLQTVISFLREEKQAALLRAMNAEVEMKRLRAETEEVVKEKSQLSQRVRSLEAQADQASAAAIEKAQLTKKLETLTMQLSQLTQLTRERDVLKKDLQEYQAKLKASQDKAAQLTTSLKETQIRQRTLESDQTARKKEMDILKQRLDNVSKATDQNLAVKLEQLSFNLSEAKAAETKAVEVANSLEKKLVAQSDRYKQLQLLCKKIRQEATDLRLQLEAVDAEQEANKAAGTTNNAKTTELETELAALKEKLAKIEEEYKNEKEKVAEKDAELTAVNMRGILLSNRLQTLMEMKQRPGNDVAAASTAASTAVSTTAPTTTQQSANVDVTAALSSQSADAESVELMSSDSLSSTSTNRVQVTPAQASTPKRQPQPPAATTSVPSQVLSSAPLVQSGIIPANTVTDAKTVTPNAAPAASSTSTVAPSAAAVAASSTAPAASSTATAASSTATVASSTATAASSTATAASSSSTSNTVCSSADAGDSVPTRNAPVPTMKSSFAFGNASVNTIFGGPSKSLTSSSQKDPVASSSSSFLPAVSTKSVVSTSGVTTTSTTSGVRPTPSELVLDDAAGEQLSSTTQAESVPLNLRLSSTTQAESVPLNLRRSTLFGLSVPTANVLDATVSSANTTANRSVDVEQEGEEAGQSSLVTASGRDVADDCETNNDSAGDGESRDSAMGAPVSSSDVSRKRGATNDNMGEAKRQRASPLEDVSSSEPRRESATPWTAGDQLSVPDNQALNLVLPRPEAANAGFQEEADAVVSNDDYIQNIDHDEPHDDDEEDEIEMEHHVENIDDDDDEDDDDDIEEVIQEIPMDPLGAPEEPINEDTMGGDEGVEGMDEEADSVGDGDPGSGNYDMDEDDGMEESEGDIDIHDDGRNRQNLHNQMMFMAAQQARAMRQPAEEVVLSSDSEDGAEELDDDDDDEDDDEDNVKDMPEEESERDQVDERGADDVREAERGAPAAAADGDLETDDNSVDVPDLGGAGDAEANVAAEACGSAVEEADDEGSRHEGTPRSSQAPPTRPARVPITMNKDDQCSSSQESGNSSAPRLHSSRRPRATRARGRGARGGRGTIYQPPGRKQ